jgi:hypothetical protein
MSKIISSFALLAAFLASSQTAFAQDEVLAFWGWESHADFTSDPSKQDYAADVDNTASGSAILQAFLGDPANLDDNGGGGWETYTSATSGITYNPTDTLKYDDLKGGGADFDIGGTTLFDIDKNDGAGAVQDDFGNDALMYLVFDTTGYQNVRYRFGIESEPDDLAASYDVFFRVGGSGTWFRDVADNNIDISGDYVAFDADNSQASLALRSFNSSINNQSLVEIIVSDFAELGNGEMEIDNFEIVATAIPEPGSLALIALLAFPLGVKRRRKS